MSCGRTLQVQAYLDGELDAVAAASIEQHLETCAECAEVRAGIVAIRKAMRGQATYHHAGAALRGRISKALRGGTISAVAGLGRRFWSGALSGAVATALAASLIVYVMAPSAQDQIASDVISAHLRSLMGTHLIDVASSNQHTVKPWFDGHADVSPPVADYGEDGFKLVGGRVDYVHGERAAVVVYRYGQHVVNVFTWKNDGIAKPGMKNLNGFRMLAWRSGDLFYCAVSDMAPAELDELSQLIRKTAES